MERDGVWGGPAPDGHTGGQRRKGILIWPGSSRKPAGEPRATHSEGREEPWEQTRQRVASLENSMAKAQSPRQAVMNGLAAWREWAEEPSERAGRR